MELIYSATFRAWFDKLKDRNARARILDRLDRAANGNLGDTKALGGGISEMRIPYGPGYRVYFLKRKQRIIVLLTGGDKATQSADIEKARSIAKQWSD